VQFAEKLICNSNQSAPRRRLGTTFAKRVGSAGGGFAHGRVGYISPIEIELKAA
jgi:hypothetical protein